MPEIEYTSIQVKTPSLRQVPNRWLRQTGQARGLLVVLPGLNYTPDNPLLYYLTRLAVDRSMDVLQLWADYTVREFQSLSKPDQLRWLLEDARSLVLAGSANPSYNKLVLAGKSIGTLTLAALVSQVDELSETAAIWLTPLFRQQVVLEAALSAKGKALFIAGAADSTFDPAALERLQQPGLHQTLLIPAANHSLEIPGDMDATLQALRMVVEASAAFLDQCLQG